MLGFGILISSLNMLGDVCGKICVGAKGGNKVENDFCTAVLTSQTLVSV